MGEGFWAEDLSPFHCGVRWHDDNRVFDRRNV